MSLSSSSDIDEDVNGSIKQNAKDLGINIHDNDWLDILSILSYVGKNIREARGKFIHYKIVHRYYYTPPRLYRMGIAGNSLCWKCKKRRGHLFTYDLGMLFSSAILA